MTADTIREKIQNGDYETKVEYPKRTRYKEGHIFDEEKSVKWNREEVERQNAVLKEQLEGYRESVNEGAKRFEKDVIEYLLDDYYLQDNKEVAKKIYGKAYSDGHSGGMYEILNEAMDLADFAEEIIKLIK